jgi:hypothetical protein
MAGLARVIVIADELKRAGKVDPLPARSVFSAHPVSPAVLAAMMPADAAIYQ